MNQLTLVRAPVRTRRAQRAAQRGLSLIELMISLGLSMVVLAGMTALLVNVSTTNNELAKANAQIENGRFAVQLIESEVVHAGFWGGFVPQFDDVNWIAAPNDTPNAVPNPCLPYNAANWTFSHINNLVGIALQSGDAAPGDCVLANKKSRTDVLVVRHADTCVAGAAGCDAQVAGKMYFQTSRCTGGAAGTAAAGSTSTTIKLEPVSSTASTASTTNAYVGMRIQLTGGTGQGQGATINAYDKNTNVATISGTWANTPDATTTYTIVENVLSTTGLNLRKRGADCGTADVADLRKFVSHIYYVRDYASTVGDGIPTLVRAEFDPAGPPALAHQSAQALVEGIEGFAVELGIDNKVTRCNLNSNVAYGVIAKVNPSTCLSDLNAEDNTLPTNRGDGNPDVFIRCTTAVPCTAQQLSNVVAVKVYLLVRNTEASASYQDVKKYCLAAMATGDVCPPASSFGPFNDRFKRHLFTTTVRLTNVSGRRETPI